MDPRNKITEGCHDPLEEYLRNMTRRRFFGTMANTMGAGLGTFALGSMLNAEGVRVGPTIQAETPEEILANLPHYAPRAKRVIYMHMEGAPSQLDSTTTSPACTTDSTRTFRIRSGVRSASPP